jgi:hypothetical protein
MPDLRRPLRQKVRSIMVYYFPLIFTLLNPVTSSPAMLTSAIPRVGLPTQRLASRRATNQQHRMTRSAARATSARSAAPNATLGVLHAVSPSPTRNHLRPPIPVSRPYLSPQYRTGLPYVIADVFSFR